MKNVVKKCVATVPMCVLTIAIDAHSDYPLVLTHTRDEYFARTATPLGQRGDILSANDEASGGTWMGLNVRTGAIAALTNVRMPPVLGTRSRGELVTRALMGDGARAISSGNYARYNLLHGLLSTDGPDLSLTVSALRPMEAHTSRVASLVGAKSNDHGDFLTTRSSDPVGQCTWPKVAWLREAVESLLASERLRGVTGEEGARELVAALAPLLSARAMPSPYRERASAWEPASVCPLPPPIERKLQAAPFIAPFELPTSDNGVVGAGAHDFLYGTVSQSVLVQCRSDGCVYYAYRETTPGPGPMPVQVPVASSAPPAAAAKRRSLRKRRRSGTNEVPDADDEQAEHERWPWTWRCVALQPPPRT